MIKVFRSTFAEVSYKKKKVFWKISRNSQENTFVGVSSFIKLQVCNLIKKEIPSQAFSSEFWEIFKNSFFIEHIRWLLLSISK